MELKLTRLEWRFYQLHCRLLWLLLLILSPPLLILPTLVISDRLNWRRLECQFRYLIWFPNCLMFLCLILLLPLFGEGSGREASSSFSFDFFSACSCCWCCRNGGSLSWLGIFDEYHYCCTSSLVMNFFIFF
uniref:Uncharacterized protein n=2 Tax=Salix viminalis TaxID=40686 RepID=A0A6N2MKV6_SALVM